MNHDQCPTKGAASARHAQLHHDAPKLIVQTNESRLLVKIDCQSYFMRPTYRPRLLPALHQVPTGLGCGCEYTLMVSTRRSS